MNKLLEILLTILFVIVCCFVISLLVPGLREVFLMLLVSSFSVVKDFMLKDFVLTIVIYLIASIVMITLGIGATRARKEKVWVIAAWVVDILGALFLVLVRK